MRHPPSNAHSRALGTLKVGLGRHLSSVLQQVGARSKPQVLKVAARGRAAGGVYQTVGRFDGRNHGRHGSLQATPCRSLVETEGPIYLEELGRAPFCQR